MSSSSVWSLYGAQPLSEIHAQIVDLEERMKVFIAENKWGRYMRVTLWGYFIAILIGLAISIVTFNFGFLLAAFILGMMVVSWMHLKMTPKVRDFAKYKLSREFGWHYLPGSDKERYVKLRNQIPEIFSISKMSSAVIDDQFFGKIYSRKKAFDFHSGIFYLPQAKGMDGGHPLTFFAFKLDKKIPFRFSLGPEKGILSTANPRTPLLKRDLNVESIEFNRKFKFFYDSHSSKDISEIFKVITPTIQLRLLEVYANNGPFRVLFSNDFVVFLFLGDFFPHYLSSTAVREDLKHDYKSLIEKKFKSFVPVVQEIAGYFN